MYEKRDFEKILLRGLGRAAGRDAKDAWTRRQRHHQKMTIIPFVQQKKSRKDFKYGFKVTKKFASLRVCPSIYSLTILADFRPFLG